MTLSTDSNTSRVHGNCYAKRSYLLDQKNDFLVDDKLTIHFEVELIQSSVNQDCLVGASLDYGTLLRNGQNTDILLVVDGEKFPAHKLILSARSSVLANLLENCTKNQEIEIPGVTAEVFHKLLHFLYSCNIEDIDHLAMDLLIAAHKVFLSNSGIITII